MDKETSLYDMYQFIGKEVPSFKYHELSKFINNPDEFFDLIKENGIVLILYGTVSPNVGHWTSIILTKDNNGNDIYEFFDPYSGKYDSEKQYISRKQLINNGEIIDYLTMILKQADLPVSYNKYQYQKYSKGVATCGRWVIVRYIFHEFSSDEFEFFINMFAKAKKMSLDRWITLFTSRLS